jgi:RNA polymerase sigma factor (sigma-70 family)
MRDGGMVAGIADDDPAAIAAAYDHYAPGLYAYCRSVLGDPPDAAEAVQDTFVVASLRLSGLREPGRLRPWLYAVARNECRRRLDERGGAPLDAGDGQTGEDTTDFGDSLEEAELRELVWSALAGLSATDRDVVELNLRHDFYGPDLADAIGVPRNQAHALIRRSRAQFETALGALLVSRSGQGSCAELARILSSWDGELTPAIRRQVHRHIDGCPGCGGQRRRVLSPVALLGQLPVFVLPGGLRGRVLGLIADGSAAAVAARVQIAQRAEPFTRSGFPAPLNPAAPVRRPAATVTTAGVLVAAFTVLGGGVVLAASTLHDGSQPATALVPALGVPSARPAPPAAPPVSAAGAGHRGGARSGPIGIIGSLAALPSPALTTGAPGSSQPAGRGPSIPASATRRASPSPTRSSTPVPTTPVPTTPVPTTPVPTTPVPTTPVPTTPVPTTPVPTTPAPTTPAPTTPSPSAAAPSTPIPSTVASLVIGILG